MLFQAYTKNDEDCDNPEIKFNFMYTDFCSYEEIEDTVIIGSEDDNFFPDEIEGW